MTIKFGGDWYVFVSANRQLYCPSRLHAAGWLDFAIGTSRIVVYTFGYDDECIEKVAWFRRSKVWFLCFPFAGCTWIIWSWFLSWSVYNSLQPNPIVGFCPNLEYDFISRDVCLADESFTATNNTVVAVLKAIIASWHMWILLLFFLVRKMILKC